MKNIIVYEEFELDIERETVLRLMDCYPESPVYEEACEEYEELKLEMEEKLKPCAVIAFGTVKEGYQVDGVLEIGVPIIYSIVTIGATIKIFVLLITQSKTLSQQLFGQIEPRVLLLKTTQLFTLKMLLL